jgi:superoxide reductase
MTKRLQVYKCEVCGIVAEVLDAGAGELVCCGEPMTLLEENIVDASREKHVPVVTKVEGGLRVAVGSVPHPMEAKHFIQWIEVLADGKAYRQFLQPGQIMTVTAEIIKPGDRETKLKAQGARIYRNVHVSGHAGRKDTIEFLKMIKAEHLIPCHGTQDKLEAMMDIGYDIGYSDDQLHLLQNGRSLKLSG